MIIVVAAAGIGGYAQPSQELAAAVRLWRLGLVLAAAALGIFPILIAANPASDVETSFLKIRDLRELI